MHTPEECLAKPRAWREAHREERRAAARLRYGFPEHRQAGHTGSRGLLIE